MHHTTSLQTATLVTQESGHCIERLKQESMCGLSAKKNGCYGQAAVSGGSTVGHNCYTVIGLSVLVVFGHVYCSCKVQIMM